MDFLNVKIIDSIYRSIYEDKWILVCKDTLEWCGYANSINKYNKKKYIELISSKFVKEEDYKILTITQFNNYDKKKLNIIFEVKKNTNNRHTYIIIKSKLFKESIMLMKTDKSKELSTIISYRETEHKGMCYYIGCRKQSIYIEENTLTYCSSHSTDKSKNINTLNCLYCFKEPYYNFKNNNKAIVCLDHKEEGMVNKKVKYCILCSYTQSHGIFKPYCSGCYYFINPNSNITRNYKIKENAIMKIVKYKYEKCILDSIISGGCSRRRPDGLLDFISFSIIIEIDENRHSYYGEICENKRMMEIFADLGSRPLCIIRFNPDTYTDNEGNPHKSLFKKNKENKIVISCEKEFNKRVEILIDAIDKKILNMSMSTELKNIDILYLFY